MPLTLTPGTETRLRELAARRGQAPEDVIDALIQREMTEEAPAPESRPAQSTASLTPTAALFAQWAEEDKTDDPEEIARRQKEGDELLSALQANHFSFRVPAELEEDGE